MPDIYGLGAEDDEVPTDQAVAKKKRETNTGTKWAIGLGIGLFVGVPILLRSVSDLVRATKE